MMRQSATVSPPPWGGTELVDRVASEWERECRAPPSPTAIDPPTILVAWSVPDRRYDVVDAIERAGYEVKEVFDGFDLLDELTSPSLWFPTSGSSYELVIANAWLPGCSGIEVLEEVRLFDWRTQFVITEARRLGLEERAQVRELHADVCLDVLGLAAYVRTRLPSMRRSA